MKNPHLLLAAVAVVSLSSGCALSEKYAKNNASAQAWLHANDKVPAKSNFEGVYYSPDWGTIVFKQRDGKLTGALSYYRIQGVVSGRTAYVLLVDDDWAEHTMILKRQNSEVVTGSYSPHVPFAAKGSQPVRLDKIVN